MNTITKTFK